MLAIPIDEQRLLAELGVLSDRIRAFRAEGHPNGLQIKTLEAQQSLKWQELRSLRAGPINLESFGTHQSRGFRR